MMTTSTPIEKGSVVYLFSHNGRATVFVRTLEVESFGKLRGTAIHQSGSGERRALNRYIYPAEVGVTLFNAADVPDVYALARSHAIALKERRIRYYRDLAHNNCMAPDDPATLAWQKVMKDKCKAVMFEQPNVVFHV